MSGSRSWRSGTRTVPTVSGSIIDYNVGELCMDCEFIHGVITDYPSFELEETSLED